MVSFADARRIAAELLAPSWPEQLGSFYVSEDGYEDADAYLMTYGAREWLVGRDERFMDWDTPAVFVRKNDGTLISMPRISCLDITTAMTPVSAHGPS